MGFGFDYWFNGYPSVLGGSNIFDKFNLFPSCPSEFLSKIGDHICDPEIVTEGCCYDKGDCEILDVRYGIFGFFLLSFTQIV